jgi:hypothetical protein
MRRSRSRQETEMSDAEKIAALEGEVARLRGELAKYKPAPVVVKVDSAFVLPDEETVERLIHRVHARYPIFKRDIERGDIKPDEFIQMTRGSLRYISTLYRLRGAVDRKTSYLDRIYTASDFLNRTGFGYTTIRGSSYMTAVVASGDIYYSAITAWPTTADVGLALGPTSGSYTATNRWLNTLANQFDDGLIIQPPQTLHAPLSEFELLKRGGWREELRRE